MNNLIYLVWRLIIGEIFPMILCIAVMAPLALQSKPILLRLHSRTVIRRTAVVMIAAQKAASKEHQYLGLGRAVAHQLYARKMYAQANYLQAIYHSLRGRALAALVINRNKGEKFKEIILDKIESAYAKKAPSDKDLDAIVDSETGDDEAALQLKIDAEIEE